ncbi:hypothetical protein ES708_31322 [subsurface metagenome]
MSSCYRYKRTYLIHIIKSFWDCIWLSLKSSKNSFDPASYRCFISFFCLLNFLRPASTCLRIFCKSKILPSHTISLHTFHTDILAFLFSPPSFPVYFFLCIACSILYLYHLIPVPHSYYLLFR